MSVNRLAFTLAAVVASALVVPSARSQAANLALASDLSMEAGPTEPLFAEALVRAKRLAESGQLKEARQLYKTTAALQREAGEYPKEALQSLALMANGDGDDRSAASLFDELAIAAHQFNDPETELTSLFQAAGLFQRSRNFAQVAAHVRQIRPLLQSSAIPEQTRSEVSKRLSFD